MSYSWSESTKLMTCTSLLLHALEECGILDTTQSTIVTRISEARAAIKASEGKAKISALKQLKALHEEVNDESTILSEIQLHGYAFCLKYENGRFVANQYDLESEREADRRATQAKGILSKLEDKYSELEKELLSNYDAVIEKLRREIDEENMRQLTATVRAEREEANREAIALHQTQREQYLVSIERRKRIADEEIMKNAKKIGYKVKKKNIGKTMQYVLVKR